MIKIDKQEDLTWYLDKVKPLLSDQSRKKEDKEISLEEDLLNRNKDKIKQINGHLKTIFCSAELRDMYDMKINLTLDELLTADYNTLIEVRDIVDFWGSLDESYKKLLGDVHDSLIFFREFEEIYKSKFSNRGVNNLIVSKLGIVVCPYCNRNFINNMNQTKASAQLDHFFNKSDYPILALSFYNLVPCCQPCNHIKGKRNLGKSPYDPEVDFNNNIKFNVRLKSSEILTTDEAIDIDIKYNKEYRENIEVLEIKNVYAFHRDYAREILVKETIYTESMLNEIFTNYPSLFKDKEEMKKALFGNYFVEDEFYKRPLSKLTADILDCD